MRKNVWKRGMAAILSAAIVFTSVDVSWAAEAVNAGDTWSTTIADVVAEEYYSGNDAVETILSYAAVDDSCKFSGTAPVGNESLAKVDGATRTLYATTYDDGGYTWEPVSATVEPTEGDPIEITFDSAEEDSGYKLKASIPGGAASYNVVVKYAVEKDFSIVDLKKYVNIPCDLANALDTLNTLVGLNDKLETIESEVSDLREQVCDESGVLYNYVDDADKAVIESASTEPLKSYVADIEGLATLKTAEKNLKDVTNETSEKLEGLEGSIGNILGELDKALKLPNEIISEEEKLILSNGVIPVLEKLKDAVASVCGTLGTIDVTSWKDSLDAMSGIDSAVEEAVANLDVEKLGVENTTFTLATCDITCNVGTVDVPVVVTIKAVNANDNTPVEESYDKKINVTDANNAEECKAAAEAVIDEAIAEWNEAAAAGYTAVDRDHYEVSGELKDGEYSVTVAPKKYLVKDWNREEKYVVYGSKIELEGHTTASKAYYYTVTGESGTTSSYMSTSVNQAVVTVKENITITRKEGAEKVTIRLYDAIADSYANELKDGVNILKDSAVNSPEITIESPTEENVGQIEYVNGSYQITVDPKVYANDECEWEAVVYVNSEKVAVGNDGIVTLPTDVETVEVEYQLKHDLDTQEVLKSAEEISKAVKKQAELLRGVEGESASNVTLRYLYNKFNKDDNYKQVSEALSMLNTISASLEPDTQDALKWMRASENEKASYGDIEYDFGGMGKNGYLAIYNHLAKLYIEAAGQIKPYYNEGYYANIKKHVDVLKDCFAVIAEDPVVLGMANMRPELAGPVEMLDEFAASLATLSAELSVLPDEVVLDDENVDVEKLADKAISAKEFGNFGEGNYPNYIVKEFKRSTNIVYVDVVLYVDGAAYSYKETFQFEKDGTNADGAPYIKLNSERVTEIKNAIASVEKTINEKLGDAKKYYKVNYGDFKEPEIDYVIERSKEYTYSYEPKVYSVTYTGGSEPLTFKYSGSMSITLPAPEASGIYYDYAVKGEVKRVEAGKTVSVLFESKDLDKYFENDTYHIERTVVDAAKAEREEFKEDVNKFVAGLNAGPDNIVSFDSGSVSEEKYPYMVISVDTVKMDAMEELLMAIGQELLMGSFNYIGFGELKEVAPNEENDFNDFKYKTQSTNETKLNAQSLVSLLLTSGLSTDSVFNGLNLTAEDDKAAIESIEEKGLGEVMGASYIQLGDSRGEAKNLRLYLAFKESDQRAEIQSYVALAQRFGMTFEMKEGKLFVAENLPDKVYQIYLSALMILDQVDIESIEDAELQKIVKHNMEILKPVFEDETISAEVIANTLRKLGLNAEMIEKYGPYLDEFLTRAHGIATGNSNITLTPDESSSANHVYGMTATYDLSSKLESIGNIDLGGVTLDVKSLLKSTDINMPIQMSLENMKEENQYEALVIDLKAANAKDKFFYTKDLSKDLSKDISKATGDSVVILLKDIEDGITLSQKTLLNLNGKTIAGNVTAGNYALTIVDSVMNNGVGGVDGTISGSDVDVTAGKYAQLTEAFVADGYKYENGVVTNKYYTIEKTATGDITVKLATDCEDIENVDIKSLALDIAADVLFDWYTNAETVIDGNTIYSVDIADVLSKSNSLGALATELSEEVNETGVTDFVNQLIKDFTDFEALEAAVSSNGNLLVGTYPMATKAWDVEMKVVNGEYIDADIIPSETAKTPVVTIQFENKDEELKTVFATLKNLVTKKDIAVKLEEVIYKNGKLNVTGEAAADVEVDFTKANGKDAIVIMSVVLANEAGDAEFAKAIQTYIDNTNNFEALKGYFDTLTLKQITEAAEAARTESFANMVQELGLNINATKAAELEAAFDGVLGLVYAIIDKLDINNNTRTLGQYGKTYEDGKYLGYGGDKENVSYETTQYRVHLDATGSAKLNLIMFEKVQAGGGTGTGGSGNGDNGGSGSSSSDKDSGKELEGVYTAPTTTPAGSTGTQTGDTSNLTLWISLMGIAAVALIAAVVIKKRKATK